MGDAGSPGIETLVERAAQGDARAFGALVERTHAVVYRLALRMLGGAAEAEDAVQETYVRAWQSLGSLRDRRAALGWICGIARNVASERRRARGRRRFVSLDQPASDDAPAPLEELAGNEAGPDERLASAEVGARVLAALEGLKEKHRLILSLREIDGMSYEEIASALGVPVGTVESRLYRARAALAKKLKALAKEAL
jgi:RNA polymerase sigma-70 factor (ECF subfamily)